MQGIKRLSVLAGVAASLLAACATNDADPLVIEQARMIAERTDALPPQTLPVGQCGIFLFGRSEPYPFILFENETTRRAQVLHDQQVYELGVSPQAGTFAIGETVRRIYLHTPSNRVFTLTARVGEQTGSGPRLDNALLWVRDLDGTETVRPVGGVYSCRERDSSPIPTRG